MFILSHFLKKIKFFFRFFETFSYFFLNLTSPIFQWKKYRTKKQKNRRFSSASALSFWKKLLQFTGVFYYNILVAENTSALQIIAEHCAKQIISVYFSDKTTRIFIIGDIGRILGQKISNDLVDGIVSLFEQRSKYLLQNHFVLFFLIRCKRERDRLIGLIIGHSFGPFFSVLIRLLLLYT